MIATEEMVVMSPATVVHHPTVSMMDDGHKIRRKSVLPIIIFQTPYLQRSARTVPDTIIAAAPARITVCLVLIEAILGFTG